MISYNKTVYIKITSNKIYRVNNRLILYSFIQYVSRTEVIDVEFMKILNKQKSSFK